MANDFTPAQLARVGRLMLILVLAGGSARSAWADFAIVDQQFTPNINLQTEIPRFSPVAQQFTPTMDSMDLVEIHTHDVRFREGSGAEIFVRIHNGPRIRDSVLAVSETIALPNAFSGTSQLRFSQSVPLTPGRLYLIEMVHAGGDDWFVDGTFTGELYAGGDAIYKGTIVTSERDYYFRQGIAASSSSSDLTNNGFVDFEDLTVLLANWNKEVTAAEGNLVNAATTPVNFEDLTFLLADWTGPGPAGSPEAALGEAVPEPSSLLLALLATLGLSFGWRRRRRS